MNVAFRLYGNTLQRTTCVLEEQSSAKDLEAFYLRHDEAQAFVGKTCRQ